MVAGRDAGRKLVLALGRDNGEIHLGMIDQIGVPNIGPQAQQVIISIADRPVKFGEPDPDAVQVFEAFRPEGKSCVWEGF